MTNELAIQEMLTVASHLKQTSQGEAVMMGVVALEKQIPKKPVLIEDKMWVCPTCDNNLHWKYAEYPNKLNGKGLPYCLCCGQAIVYDDCCDNECVSVGKCEHDEVCLK